MDRLTYSSNCRCNLAGDFNIVKTLSNNYSQVIFRKITMREIKDFKPFIPSNDYEVSKAFYECMGFEINWDSDEACEIDTKFGYRFLLLPKNHNNYSESLMLPLVAKPELIHGD